MMARLFCLFGFVSVCLWNGNPFSPTGVTKNDRSVSNVDQTKEGSNWRPESLLVTLQHEFSGFDAKSDSFLEPFGFTKITDLTRITNQRAKSLVQKDFRKIFRVELTDDQKRDYSNLKKTLEGREEVFSVEPDACYETQNSPNDTYFANHTLWGLDGTNGINAPTAWDYSTGSTSIRVGIIDTGIAYHDDLNANLASGYDFYNGDSVTHDDTDGHGTHIAGIIGAQGNNNAGVVGVNWHVSLVPLQCVDSSNHVWASYAVSALTYATNCWGTTGQIDVINFSFGGFGSDVAIRTAIGNYPGLFVWAVGNETTDVDVDIALHGSFSLSNLISVGALDSTGDRRANSNYSSSNTNLDIYAPGGNIYSTYLSEGLTYLSGTSMAAPFVSGTAALLLSIHPHLSAQELKTLILNNASTGIITIPAAGGGTTSQYVKKLRADTAAQAASYMHVYSDHYVFESSTGHRAYCSCGLYTLKPHAVLPGSTIFIGGHFYGNCVDCGALIDVGSTPIVAPTSLEPSSVATGCCQSSLLAQQYMHKRRK